MFVATGQQFDQRFASPDEIDPISRPVIDAKLRHAFADRLRISGIAERQTVDARLDSRFCSSIAQIPKPGCKCLSLANLDHSDLSLIRDDLSSSMPGESLPIAQACLSMVFTLDMGSHISVPIAMGFMKTTVEISDALLREARKVAAREGVTLRTLVERGLHRVVAETNHATPFKLRRASFKGKGLQAELGEPSWDRLRDLTYAGRGA